MKPYKPRLLQALHKDDGDRLQEFCKLMLKKFNAEPDFIDKIIWSDESMFKLNGHINGHNCIYWSDVNPKVTMQHELNLPEVTVWCSISSAGIIGPYFFKNTGNYIWMTCCEIGSFPNSIILFSNGFRRTELLPIIPI